MKKSIVLFLFFLTVPFLFADEITDLLDKAKMQYSNNETEALIKSIDTIKEKLKKKDSNYSSLDAQEVSLNRLKVTPEKYVNKPLKVRGVAISSSGFDKLKYYNNDKEYGVVVTNIEQNEIFYNFLDEGKIVFVMDDSLVDILLDEIPVGYSHYFNIWTEPVYKYSYYLSSYSPERFCYIAKIIKLESVEYNIYSGAVADTGELFEN